MSIKIKKFEELSKIIPILTYQKINEEKSIVRQYNEI